MPEPTFRSQAVRRFAIVALLAVVESLLCPLAGPIVGTIAGTSVRADEPHRSPIDLALSADERWIVTANQTSDSISLVRTADGRVVDELRTGRRPAAIVWLPDESGDRRRLLVTGSYSGDVAVVALEGEKLKLEATIPTGFEPTGIAVDKAGRRAYVALAASDQVAVVDLERREVTSRIDVGRWPRYLALSPDGSRLAVGASGDRGVSVVDTASGKMAYLEQFLGLNVGHMQTSSDGLHVYFPWMVYRHNPITAGNIRLGWVLASRIARLRLDGPARREAFSLDPPGQAIADPFGLALSADERRLVVSASGTRELLVYRRADLPFQDYGGTDHVPPELLKDKERFARIPLGGRPMGLRIARDNRTVYVANYLENAVQVVDVEERRVTAAWPLGGPREPSLERRGEEIFYDARRSLDQWYSCHTCHYEGGSNAERMDTFNDRSAFTFKTVLPLHHVDQTPPWTWHGWQTDLADAMRTSITGTMLGKEPSADDVAALVAYLKSLELPPNPFRLADGRLTPLAEQGRTVFQSEKAGCTNCHSGPRFTDGQTHDVGLADTKDRKGAFNTPSLTGVYRRVRLLHDGRARTLDELLAGPHAPSKVTGRGDLSDEERRALVEYLKSL